jgi:thiol:disulfide interchange protein
MLLSLALIAGATLSDGGTRFFDGSFAEALELSATLEKPVFVDFYADW